MKTVVMKRSDREKKDRETSYGIPAAFADDDYFHGLHITLDDDCLKKLGINGMPKPGDHFRIEGEAHVTESAQRDTDKDSDRRVELVLHKLGAEKTDEDEDAKPEKSIRDELEDAHHRARGTTAPSPGRLGGARQASNGRS
jgi:hypothetical protein